MPKVDLEKPIPVPAVPAREAASAILHDIETGAREWAGFALHLNLGAIGLPDVGYIAIPIRLAISREENEPRHQIRFTINARRSPEAFPVFDGALGVDSEGPSSSQVWLGGNYELPLHGLGAFFEKNVARNGAEKTLENMLTDLAEAIAARAERRELAQARYRMFGTE